MLKFLAAASLFFAFTSWHGRNSSCPGDAASQSTRHQLCAAGCGGRLPRLSPLEGRSIYRMEAPSTFYGGTDERGYPSGEPQNPRTGD